MKIAAVKQTIIIMFVMMFGCAGVRADIPQPADGKPWNFVIILVDDMGWMDLGCQGSKFYETPNTDRLASQGMRFTNGYAACAVCSPTRAAMQTGRYPARIGVTDWIRAKFQGGIMPEPGETRSEYVGQGSTKPLLTPRNPLYMKLGELTLAEALKPAGYVSCFIGKWHLGQEDHFPEKQGYDENHGGCDLGQPPSYFDPYYNKRPNYLIPNLPPRKEGEYLADREADEAVRFIKQNKDKPFLLSLCHYEVHTPIQGKKELVEKYKAKEKTNQKNPTYAAMVESVDDAVGKVMATLKENGVADRTVVIFTSDNGGVQGITNNQPLRAGKGEPYEGGLRVPVIVRWPGVVKAGTTCEEPVITCDYFPTILQIAGIKPPTDRTIDGQSIVPLLTQSGSLPTRTLFWHFPHFRSANCPYSVVRRGEWKLIHFDRTDTFELYNLSDDLSETTDLAKSNPGQVKQMVAELNRMYKQTGAKLVRKNPDYKPASK